MEEADLPGLTDQELPQGTTAARAVVGTRRTPDLFRSPPFLWGSAKSGRKREREREEKKRRGRVQVRRETGEEGGRRSDSLLPFPPPAREREGESTGSGRKNSRSLSSSLSCQRKPGGEREREEGCKIRREERWRQGVEEEGR